MNKNRFNADEVFGMIYFSLMLILMILGIFFTVTSKSNF